MSKLEHETNKSHDSEADLDDKSSTLSKSFLPVIIATVLILDKYESNKDKVSIERDEVSIPDNSSEFLELRKILQAIDEADGRIREHQEITRQLGQKTRAKLSELAKLVETL